MISRHFIKDRNCMVDVPESRRFVLDFIASHRESISRLYDGNWDSSFPAYGMLEALGFETRQVSRTHPGNGHRGTVPRLLEFDVPALHCYDEDEDILMAMLHEMMERFPVRREMETQPPRDENVAERRTSWNGHRDIFESTDDYLSRIISDRAAEDELRSALPGCFDAVDDLLGQTLEQPIEQVSASDRWQAAAALVEELVAKDEGNCTTTAGRRRLAAQQEETGTGTGNELGQPWGWYGTTMGTLAAFRALSARKHVVTALRETFENPVVLLGAMLADEPFGEEHVLDVLRQDPMLDGHMDSYVSSILSVLRRTGVPYARMLSDMRNCLVWEHCCCWGREMTNGGHGVNEYLVKKGMELTGYAATDWTAGDAVRMLNHDLLNRRGARR